MTNTTDSHKSAAGTKRWLAGAAIALVVLLAASILVAVFLARRPATVPDLRKQPVSTATELLEGARLRLGDTSEVATSALGDGRVLSQSPAAGSEVTRQSSVDVTVAVQPEYRPLPELLGQDAATAIGTLVDALYLPQQIMVFDATGEAGTVVGQFPPADTTWMTGLPVAVAVSAGPSDGTALKVPDTRGLNVDEAKLALKRAGLLGAGFLVDVNTPENNVVIYQLPEGGVLVSPGTTVLLLLKAR